VYAQQVDSSKQVYLNTSNGSLNKTTATETMTRAEFVYMIVQRYYSSEYSSMTDDTLKTTKNAYTDLKNAGDVAKSSGIETVDKTTGVVSKPSGTEQAVLHICELQPTHGLDTD